MYTRSDGLLGAAAEDQRAIQKAMWHTTDSPDPHSTPKEQLPHPTALQHLHYLTKSLALLLAHSKLSIFHPRLLGRLQRNTQQHGSVEPRLLPRSKDDSADLTGVEVV